MALLFPVLLLGVMWFAVIAPQRKRVRAHDELVASLQPGTVIVTTGGVHGTITAVADETVQLEVAPGTVITLARMAVLRHADTHAETDTPADADGPTDERSETSS